LAELLRELKANKYRPDYQEYLTSNEKVRATLPFKSYCELKCGSCPEDLDEDYFKSTGKEVKKDEHEEQVEEHASSHEEDVFIEEDQTTAYETSSKLNDEVDDVSVLDGYTFDESAKDEDATSHDDDVEDPTTFTMYDAYDVGSLNVIVPMLDEDSTPYLSYDADDDEDVIAPRQGLEDQLLVKEEQIVQVLTRAVGAHKFIKDLMWKAQMEERQKGVVDEITSAQLRIMKEALEQMKSDYLQLFMDRDLAIKFTEDKEREIEELCY
jgi:hypothetical protein